MNSSTVQVSAGSSFAHSAESWMCLLRGANRDPIVYKHK